MILHKYILLIYLVTFNSYKLSSTDIKLNTKAQINTVHVRLSMKMKNVKKVQLVQDLNKKYALI